MKTGDRLRLLEDVPWEEDNLPKGEIVTIEEIEENLIGTRTSKGFYWAFAIEEEGIEWEQISKIDSQAKTLALIAKSLRRAMDYGVKLK